MSFVVRVDRRNIFLGSAFLRSVSEGYQHGSRAVSLDCTVLQGLPLEDVTFKPAMCLKVHDGEASVNVCKTRV